MTHALDKLLRPASVAVVGASATADSMGCWTIENLLRGGFGGNLYLVNPRYEKLRDRPCYASLADLPETPDLVIFAVADHRIEQALDEAIDANVPAAVIMSSLHLDNDSSPDLSARVRQKVSAAGMLICGANGMGFYNVRDKVWACGFDSRMLPAEGNVSLISHSGSGMSGIIDCEARLRTNLAVSTGNELTVTMDQYLDFALDLPETKVVGLFIETARNAAGFRAALEKAVAKKIPVVALKVGRTARSAELTISHSGSIAGDDATYAALFDRYGVHRVADMDELATALIMFAELNPLGPGGLVTLHDSGGERQLIVDLADDAGVPLTDLSPQTVLALRKHLDPELPPVNPLDAWSRGGADAGQKMMDCLAVMMRDENAAIGAAVHDRAPDGKIYPTYVRYIEYARRAAAKPVALVASRQGTGADPLVVDTTERGLPVLDGLTPFLHGVRGLMNYRDFHAAPAMVVPVAPAGAADKWCEVLSDCQDVDEYTSLSMLQDFGIPTSSGQIVAAPEALCKAANLLGYPLVLKTANNAVAHKTDQRGVVLNIADEENLLRAYTELADRLGPRVLVAQLVPEGVEMLLGARRDPQFGAVIVIGFGGTLAEVLQDVVFAIPPFDAAYAKRRIDELTLRPLLDGVRGGKPVVIDKFCEIAARFSVMVTALGSRVREIDVNPVIVNERDAIAVDALVIPAA